MNYKNESRTSTPKNVRNEVRKIFPEIFAILATTAETLINQIEPPANLIVGKNLHEAQSALEAFRQNTSREIHTLLKQELASMLVHAEEPPQTETVEILPEPTPQPIQTPKRAIPQATLRSIIKDRVSDAEKEAVLNLAAAGKKAPEIRELLPLGMKLNENLIQTIINDNPIVPKTTKPEQSDDTPPKAAKPTEKSEKAKEEAAAYTKRKVKRLYKQGFTPEYIAEALEKTLEEIEALIPDINIEDTEPTLITLALLENLKGTTPEAAAEQCNLRVEVAAHHMNGTQAEPIR